MSSPTSSATGGAISGAVSGLIVGYMLFGQVNGNFLPLDALLGQPRGLIGNFGYWALGIEEIRQRILLCGVGGLVLGAIVAAVGGAGTRRPPIQPPSEERPRVKCPHCAELIMQNARICRYCRNEVGADDQAG